MGKKPWKSVGFWGIVVAGVIGALEKTGVLPTGAESAAAQLAALLIALFGRARATEPLRFTGR